MTFEDLAKIYRNTAFDAEGIGGTVTIGSPEILALLNKIDQEPEAGSDANIGVLTDGPLSTGQDVRANISAPRINLGVLARSLDDFLNSPNVRVREPSNFFVIDGKLEKSTPSAFLTSYRQVLNIIDLLARAAAYYDETKSELIFFGHAKVNMPIVYSADTILKTSAEHAAKVTELFSDEIHQEHKFELLSVAAVHLTEGRPKEQRLAYLLENLDALHNEVRNGYRLFTSSFSYAKIKGEVEGATSEYVNKVHKTLTDIQGQLLGIPVATIIVASQMKPAATCGADFWTSFAVLCGAYIFSILLVIALVNQWLTLNSISNDVRRQKDKLIRDYVAISDQFVGGFKKVENRICWHRAALILIGFIGVSGSVFATAVYNRSVSIAVTECVWPKPSTNPAKPAEPPQPIAPPPAAVAPPDEAS